MEQMNHSDPTEPQGSGIPPQGNVPPNQGYYYQNHPYYNYPPSYRPVRPVVLKKEPYPAQKREMVYLLLAVVCGWMFVNFTLYGGFYLGFSIAVILCMGCAAGYLMASGRKLGKYSGTLLTMSVILAAGFARSGDGAVKFAAFVCLSISATLGMCLLAGKNCFPVGSLGTVLDGPQCLVGWGFGDMGVALGGVRRTVRSGGTAVRKGGAVVVGLCVAVPIICLLVSLLMAADAAFYALIQMLPQFSLGRAIATVLFGSFAAAVLYSWGTALRYHPRRTDKVTLASANLHYLTVNTVMVAVGVVYCVYLLSQLAYFVGGFSGILPEGFTMAEYARRGFFEMAILCGVNLTLIALAVGLVTKQDGKAPLSTRILCLIVGLVTVFLVATASAKMLLYIGGYGLTRLRVLTEVAMVFLGLATVIVCVWLFVPRLPYMQVVLVLALVICAGVLWADVDTVVARYNVSAYQSGKLEQIDMNHLSSLGDGAIVYVARLTDDSDPAVARRAKEILEEREIISEDFRSWHYTRWMADRVTRE